MPKDFDLERFHFEVEFLAALNGTTFATVIAFVTQHENTAMQMKETLLALLTKSKLLLCE